MIRWLALGVVIVAVAAASTVALQYVPAAGDATDAAAPAYPVAAKLEGPPPVATVEGGEMTHRFGTMSQRDTGKRVWKVRNTGQGNLELWKGTSTCMCTVASLKDGERAVLKPGEATDIILEWKTNEVNGTFSKGSAINTNDPEHPELAFKVEGTVRPAVVTLPPVEGGGVSFLTVSNDEDHAHRFALFSPDKADLKVTKVATSTPGLEVRITPMDDADRAPLKLPSGGYRVELVLKKGGISLGQFREEAILSVDHPLQGEVKVVASGTMAGPISAIPERLWMRQVDGNVGASRDVTLWVRNREESTHFEVARKPENLKVEVAAIDNPVKGASKYRMTVTVPPGTPAGTAINDEVLLKTDHPMAAEVKVPVHVVVTGGPG